VGAIIQKGSRVRIQRSPLKGRYGYLMSDGNGETVSFPVDLPCHSPMWEGTVLLSLTDRPLSTYLVDPSGSIMGGSEVRCFGPGIPEAAEAAGIAPDTLVVLVPAEEILAVDGVNQTLTDRAALRKLFKPADLLDRRVYEKPAPAAEPENGD